MRYAKENLTMAQHSTNGGSATLTTDTRSAFRTTQESLDQLIQEVRRNGEAATEPKAQALFETTAEVLIGLKKAYDDYVTGKEEAWQ
jgi:hypothetical protein